MTLSDALILEFQQILKEEFGLDVVKQEATAMAGGLVGYFDLLKQLHSKQ